MKRILFSAEAIADIRAISKHLAKNILTSIHRLADSEGGRVKALQDLDKEKRRRVGDYRVRFTAEHPDTLHIHTVKNRKDAYR